jgi:hypothetical protein
MWMQWLKSYSNKIKNLSKFNTLQVGVNNNPDKQKRQSTYIEAIESTGVKIIYGNYQNGTQECKRCENVWVTAKKK